MCGQCQHILVHNWLANAHPQTHPVLTVLINVQKQDVGSVAQMQSTIARHLSSKKKKNKEEEKTLHFQRAKQSSEYNFNPQSQNELARDQATHCTSRMSSRHQEDTTRKDECKKASSNSEWRWANTDKNSWTTEKRNPQKMYWGTKTHFKWE